MKKKKKKINEAHGLSESNLQKVTFVVVRGKMTKNYKNKGRQAVTSVQPADDRITNDARR